ncbi:MAG: hypothetical protein DRN66_03400 [Candidatus Nanohalarchaeota archaeon]|nr:MAG: hypothetical protein DRN66_03400 [Candidatus Nanohaloarchaeota archaeon]
MKEINLKGTGLKVSPSEKKGINLIKKSDKNILGIGISTGGFAEVQMSLKNKNEKIIATTIDKKGLTDTKKYLKGSV